MKPCRKYLQHELVDLPSIRLQEIILELQQQNADLQSILEKKDRSLLARNAELHFGKLLNVVTTRHGERWDVTAPTGVKIEIKYSSVSKPNTSGGRPKPFRNWGWGSILGSDGKKEYDRLILMGQITEETCMYYSGIEHDAEYIYFDVPFSDLALVFGNYKTKNAITFCVNPGSVLERWDGFYRKYRTTEFEIIRRYTVSASS